MWQASGMTSQALWVFPEPVLVAFGAKMNAYIHQHQWWRFITPMFIHIGILHLLVNMYSLWIIGPYVERLYGSSRFIFFWVVTGAAGVVASYLTVVNSATPLGPIARFLFKTQDFPSAGASGALFGLVGVLFVFGIKFRNELPEGFKRAFGTGMLPVILINLFIGYMAHGFIDNAAHVGGLVSGAILALVVGYRRPGERDRLTIAWHVLAVIAIAAVMVSFFKVIQHYRDSAPRVITTENNSNEKESSYVTYAAAMNDAQETFFQALDKDDASHIDESVKSIESVPSLDSQADELRNRLKLLLLKAKLLQIQDKPENKKGEAVGRSPEKKELLKEFSSWSRDYSQWLRSTAKRYSGEFN